MKHFGIPKCPYCGKHVNLIRMWTLKRDGEYVCPYCKGISNVKHSPLVLVLAGLCAVTSFIVFAFTRFVLDEADLMTCVYVFLPFVVFFFFSMFMVYLEEPVMRQGTRVSDEARRDAAVMRRRQKEAMAAEASVAQRRTVQRKTGDQQTKVMPRVNRELRPDPQVTSFEEKQKRPVAHHYTDISSSSGRFAPKPAQNQQKTQNTRDIYSSSRGQGYSYSTSAHLRTQDEEAAAARRRKIEALKRLQQEQNQAYQSPQDSDRNGQ